MCFGLFFMYKDYQQSLVLQVHAVHNPDDVIVRLLPFSAKKPRIQKRIAKRTGVTLKKQAKKVIKKKPQTKLAQIKKVVSKPKVVEKKVAEKAKSKPSEKVEKKIESKPVEQVIKKETPVIKKEEKLTESLDTKVSNLASTSDEPNTVPVPDQALKNAEPVIEQVEENVRYVTHKELQGIELENALQASVQEVWQPPVGIDQDVMSEVQVTVGWDGKLIESKILKLADIVIYDVAVQEALEEIKFPRQVWGKEIKIAFRP